MKLKNWAPTIAALCLSLPQSALSHTEKKKSCEELVAQIRLLPESRQHRHRPVKNRDLALENQVVPAISEILEYRDKIRYLDLGAGSGIAAVLTFVSASSTIQIHQILKLSNDREARQTSVLESPFEKISLFDIKSEPFERVLSERISNEHFKRVDLADYEVWGFESLDEIDATRRLVRQLFKENPDRFELRFGQRFLDHPFPEKEEWDLILDTFGPYRYDERKLETLGLIAKLLSRNGIAVIGGRGDMSTVRKGKNNEISLPNWLTQLKIHGLEVSVEGTIILRKRLNPSLADHILAAAQRLRFTDYSTSPNLPGTFTYEDTHP